jgi:hypothetical protein
VEVQDLAIAIYREAIDALFAGEECSTNYKDPQKQESQ